MSKMGVGARVESRLYLEGRLVENCLLSSQVAGTVGGPATAQLSIVPTNTAKHIMAGTWVHLFATDPWDADAAGDLSDYKLLFEGIVVGRGFTREGGGRHFVLQCADPSIYWVNAKQFWLNLNQSGGGLVSNIIQATSAGEGKIVTLTDEPKTGYFLSRLAKLDKNAEDRFLETIVSGLDDVGNINAFYNNARNRFRITDRIVISSGGKLDQLFTLSLLTDFMTSLVGRKSGQTNMAQLVNLLLAPVYHEWVSIPAPPILRKSEIFSRDIYGNARKAPVKKRVGGKVVTMTSIERASDTIIGSILFKPQVYTLPPPTCNVLFPNMYDHQSYSESFMSESTRLVMYPQYPIKIDKEVLSQLSIMRPHELETFRGLYQELSLKRDEMSKFGDGGGQTSRLNGFDWTTNDERIRGIAYNFINLPPSATAMTMSQQEGATPAEKGKGMRRYQQNVASYEYYRSKFQTRTSSFTGPYNPHVVPGFTLLALDDSDANMNIVSYLAHVTHSIDAKGVAQTTYGVKYPRILGEPDWNRPIFENQGGGDEEPKGDLEDGNQQFRFERMFDGQNRPAIPEWFGDEWRKVGGLNRMYSKLLGVNDASGVIPVMPVVSVENVMYESGEQQGIVKTLQDAKYPPSDDIVEYVSSQIRSKRAIPLPIFDVSIEVEYDADDADVGAIDLQEIATVLNERYSKAKDNGAEFDHVARFTMRPMVKIDEAFRFIGARPEIDEGSSRNTRERADGRQYDYRSETFETFVGDTRSGSGYSGITIDKGDSQGSERRFPQMSGAFPGFDTVNHSEVTKDTRILESEPSSYARYDGRPVMLDFEKFMFEKSKNSAKDDPEPISIAGFEIPLVRRTANQTPEQQAATGVNLDAIKNYPLPRPLSEKQVVNLRRKVVEAYKKELRERRGFSG